MAHNKLLDSNFNWGDVVVIKLIAPERYKPGFQGSVCGIRSIDSVEVSKQFDQMLGSELYLVEFNDGETLEVPKCYLTLSNEVF